MGPFSLLVPRVQAARHVIVRHKVAVAVWGLILLVPVVGLYSICRGLFVRIDNVPLIGWLLNRHLISMFFFSLQMMLLFSNVISALAAFFSMGELELAFSSPVPYSRIFIARYCEVMAQSSWMVFVLLIPFLWAYGRVYSAPFYYFPGCIAIVIPYFLTATGAGILITLLLASVLPVRQTRGMLQFFAVFATGVLVLVFRMLRPEQLVKPDKFLSFAHYLDNLWNPQLDATPAGWAARATLHLASQPFADAATIHLSLWAGGIGMTVLAWIAAVLIHRRAWAAYAEGAGAGLADLPLRELFERIELPPEITPSGLVSRCQALLGLTPGQAGPELERILAFLPGRHRALVSARIKDDLRQDVPDRLERLLGWMSPGLRAILVKDLRVLQRSPVLWTQMMLMGVIIAIYVYNIYLLPVETLLYVSLWLPDTLTFLNIGFVSFILVAAALRFGYPMISMEGPVFRLIRASPLDISRYVSLRFWAGFVPLLAMGLFLALASAWVIHPRDLVGVFSVVDVILMAAAITALSVAFGARFRDFNRTNPAEIPASFGGLAYMIASLFLGTAVLLLQAYPFWVYMMERTTPFRATRFEHGACGALIAVSLIVCGAITRRSLVFASRELAEGEA